MLDAGVIEAGGACDVMTAEPVYAAVAEPTLDASGLVELQPHGA